MFEQQADALRAEALDFQKLERGCGIFFEHLVAPLEAAALLDLGKNGRDAFADAGDVGDFALGVFKNRRDLFGMPFDHAGGVAVAADAERILAGDFHQVGGFVEEVRWRGFPFTVSFLYPDIATNSIWPEPAWADSHVMADGVGHY